jgi:hypothetical protein
MSRFKVRIEGKTPLLCNRFTDEAAMKASSGNGMAIVGNKPTPMAQAESRLYIGLSGKPTIPQPNVFRCLIDAGVHFKAGKSKVTTQKSSLIPACLEIDGTEFEIEHTEPWTVDTRAVCIPSTGGRILCHRPKFNDWAIEFEIDSDGTIADDLLRDVVDAAGRRVGLGDFRPARKGPFGKFVVTRWEKVAA